MCEQLCGAKVIKPPAISQQRYLCTGKSPLAYFDYLAEVIQIQSWLASCNRHFRHVSAFCELQNSSVETANIFVVNGNGLWAHDTAIVAAVCQNEHIMRRVIIPEDRDFSTGLDKHNVISMQGFKFVRLQFYNTLCISRWLQ